MNTWRMRIGSIIVALSCLWVTAVCAQVLQKKPGVQPEMQQPRQASVVPGRCSTPDKVAVTDLTLNPAQPIEGQQVTVVLGIKNLCNVPLPDVEWQLFRTPANQLLSTGMPLQAGLPPGQTQYMQLTWTAVSGQQGFRVLVDPRNLLGEEGEHRTNNTKSISVNVGSAASGNTGTPMTVTSVSVSVPSYVPSAGAPLPKLTIETSGSVTPSQRMLVSSSHPGILGQFAGEATGVLANFSPQSGRSSYSLDLYVAPVVVETQVTITATSGSGAAKTTTLTVKPAGGAPAATTAGGSPFTSDCGSDGVMVGIRARTGSLVDSVQALCTRVNGNGAWVGGQFEGARAGGNGGSPVDLRCADGSAVTAVYGKSGTLVDSIGVRCGRMGAAGATLKIVGGATTVAAAGGSGGSAFDTACSGEQIAKGISGRSGTLIDQLSSVACHNPTPQTATGVAAPVLVSVEPTADGYALVGRGFGTDATIVQVYEQLGRVPASSVSLVSDQRIVVGSQPSGVIMHSMVVGFQASNAIRYTHPTRAVPGAAPSIELFRITPPILIGDNILVPAGTVRVTATVTLTAPALAGGMQVPLASSHPVNVPASVNVPEGSRTGTVTFTPPKLSENSTTVTVTAGQGASRKTATLSIVYAELQSFTVEPPSVTGGVRSVGTIILTAAAPVGGFVVPLVNRNSAADVRSSITVPAGDATVSFAIPTREVNADVSGTITAGQGTYAQTRPITVRR